MSSMMHPTWVNTLVKTFLECRYPNRSLQTIKLQISGDRVLKIQDGPHSIFMVDVA